MFSGEVPIFQAFSIPSKAHANEIAAVAVGHVAHVEARGEELVVAWVTIREAVRD